MPCPWPPNNLLIEPAILMALRSRQLLVHPQTNAGKLLGLEALVKVYRHYLQACIDALLEARVLRPSREQYRRVCPPAPNFSSNLADACKEHAADMVSTWSACLYSCKIKRHIGALKRAGILTDEQAHTLYWVGRYGASEPKGLITQQDLDAYWALVLDPGVGGNKPKVSNRVGIRLNVNTGALANRERDLTRWWLGVSSLSKNHRIQLPLSQNPHLAKIADVRKGMELRQDRRGRWHLQVVETKEYPVPTLDPQAPRVGVDVGLNCIAATSTGRLYGQDLKPKFYYQHQKIRRIRANRQRQGLMENSGRLDRLEDRLSGLTKSACGHVANRLIQDHPGHTFVVEDLDLRGCKGSKRFCYRGLHRALAGKAPCLQVNPAYTSQTCPSCGYVHRSNRHGTKFKCRSCGRVSHADLVGGLNLLRRSEDQEILLNDYPVRIRTLLEARYRANRSSAPRGDPALGASNQELTRGSPDGTSIALNAEGTEFQAKPSTYRRYNEPGSGQGGT